MHLKPTGSFQKQYERGEYENNRSGCRRKNMSISLGPVQPRETGNDWFAFDCYRRFIDMFGDVVMEVPHEYFEKALQSLKDEQAVELDTELNVDNLKELVDRYKAVYQKHTGGVFPQDPDKQLRFAINAVFGSWNSNRAIKYRKINKITGLLGTAVNVQAMVYGNMGDDCATGVCFTRSPSDGSDHLYGEFLINAQGEDVVAGIRTPVISTIRSAPMT